jgi:hypothetical protein
MSAEEIQLEIAHCLFIDIIGYSKLWISVFSARAITAKLCCEEISKLRDLCLSIFRVKWPEASQFTLINSAMLPFANLQFAVDSVRKCLHAAAQMFRARAVVRAHHFSQC